MKNVALGLVLLLMGLSRWGPALPSAAGQEKAEEKGRPEKELRKLEADWAAAVEKNDADQIARFFADDFIFIGPRGNLQDRKQHLEDFRSGTLAVEEAKIEDMQVHVHGSAAVVSSRFTVKGKIKGMDISGPYRFTDTWVRQDGRWLAVARQQIRIVSAP